MKLKLLALVVIFLLSGCITYPHNDLYQKKPAYYSYIIGNIHNDKIKMQHAAEVYVTPASCQKAVTALLALKYLGPEFQYHTTLSINKKKGRIQDVVVSFSGDPTLTSENLKTLLAPLKNTKANGNIILDASAYKTSPHSNNIMIDDLETDYAQPVFGINIDKNLENETSPLEIEPFILHKFKQIMDALNITGKVEIVKDKSRLPGHLTQINVVKSEPLKAFIVPALKQSDNLVFDSLYLKIIHTNSDQIGTWEDGNEIIKDLIEQYFNVDMKEALLVDGSGLSRYNRIQPRQLYQILKQGYFISDFVQALPTPGECNTTLEQRVNLPKYISAKTGSMSGVSCLCGYSIKETPMVFVIMANSFSPPLKEIFEVTDAFVKDHL